MVVLVLPVEVLDVPVLEPEPEVVVVVVVGLRGVNVRGDVKAALPEQGSANGARLGFVDGHNDDIDHDLRLRPVEIVNELFDESHGVHRTASDDRVLRSDGKDALEQLRTGSNRIEYFLEFVHRTGILNVEDPYDFILVFLAFRIAFLRDEDCVLADRLPEGMSFECNVVQRLLQRYVVQLKVKVLPCYGLNAGGVKQDVDAGQLCDALVQKTRRLVIDLDSGQPVGDGAQKQADPPASSDAFPAPADCVRRLS